MYNIRILIINHHNIIIHHYIETPIVIKILFKLLYNVIKTKIIPSITDQELVIYILPNKTRTSVLKNITYTCLIVAIFQCICR